MQPIGKRQDFGQSALRRYRVELRVSRLAQSIGAEENPLAVWSPPDNAIRIGVEGHALGNAAGSGHREDIDVAVVFAGERERLAVGRKRGVAFEARPAMSGAKRLRLRGRRARGRPNRRTQSPSYSWRASAQDGSCRARPMTPTTPAHQTTASGEELHSSVLPEPHSTRRGPNHPCDLVARNGQWITPRRRSDEQW